MSLCRRQARVAAHPAKAPDDREQRKDRRGHTSQPAYQLGNKLSAWVGTQNCAGFVIIHGIARVSTSHSYHSRDHESQRVIHLHQQANRQQHDDAKHLHRVDARLSSNI